MISHVSTNKMWQLNKKVYASKMKSVRISKEACTALEQFRLDHDIETWSDTINTLLKSAPELDRPSAPLPENSDQGQESEGKDSSARLASEGGCATMKIPLARFSSNVLTSLVRCR
jgi:hypothetical protein